MADVSALAARAPISCPVCGSGSVIMDRELAGYRIWECRSCRLAFVCPTPSARELSDWYAAFFSSAAATTGDGPERYVSTEARNQELARKHCSFVLSRTRPRRVLDVGCAHGHFLACMRGAGCAAQGIELDPEAAAVAKGRGGITIHVGQAEELLPRLAGFDLVTLWANIEHVRDPAAVLQGAHGAINPGGMLALSTGMHGGLVEKVMRGYSMWYDPPQHLWYFSPKSLKLLLASVGFKDVRWQIALSLRSKMIDTCWQILRLGKHAIRLLPHLHTYHQDKRTMRAASGTEIVVTARK